mmetsp:Transcript_6958/g.9336  ORF Transcript_6958/g.9336 Transcript_6958/m.9336 type:complete len:592 (-) Transcript_6958:144-1919(-)
MAQVSSDELFVDGERIYLDWYNDGNYSAGFVLKSTEDSKYSVVTDNGEISEAHEANIRKQELDGEGFLSAARLGVTKAVRTYLERGKNEEETREIANYADPVTGQTALHEACACGQLEVLQLLLDHGAKWTLENAVQMTAVELAASKGQTGIVSLALQARCKAKETKASRFHRMFRKIVPEISPQNVVLVSRKDFLDAGKFQSYHIFAEKKQHVHADSIPKTARILMISHRWAEPTCPDPSGVHFSAAQEYISQQDPPIDYIWIDFSCCDPESKLTRIKQIKSLPLVIFFSSLCLVLPPYGTLGAEGRGDPSKVSPSLIGASISDLGGYLGRTWCGAEALCCALTGCPIDVAFSVEGYMLEFIRQPGPGHYDDKDHLRGGLSGHLNGFQRAALHAASKFPLQSLPQEGREQGGMDCSVIWKEVLRDWWWLEYNVSPMDPAGFLSNLCTYLLELKNEEMFLVKAATYSLKTEDMDYIRFGQQNLREFAETMGRLTDEEDRVLIIQMIMVVLIFCLDCVPSYFEDKESDSEEEKEERIGVEAVRIDERCDTERSVEEPQPTTPVPQAQIIEEGPPVVKSKCCSCSKCGKCAVM